VKAKAAQPTCCMMSTRMMTPSYSDPPMLQLLKRACVGTHALRAMGSACDKWVTQYRIAAVVTGVVLESVLDEH